MMAVVAGRSPRSWWRLALPGPTHRAAQQPRQPRTMSMAQFKIVDSSMTSERLSPWSEPFSLVVPLPPRAPTGPWRTPGRCAARWRRAAIPPPPCAVTRACARPGSAASPAAPPPRTPTGCRTRSPGSPPDCSHRPSPAAPTCPYCAPSALSSPLIVRQRRGVARQAATGPAAVLAFITAVVVPVGPAGMMVRP